MLNDFNLTSPMEKSIYSSKEECVKKYLDSKNLEFQYNHAFCRTLGETYLRRTPDFYKQIGRHYLVVEVDQFQHKSYNKDDESKRNYDLYEISHAKWIHIRFNPDMFRNSKGERKDPHISLRLRILHHEIKKQTKRIKSGDIFQASSMIEVIYLFYDGFEYD